LHFQTGYVTDGIINLRIL